MEVSVSTLSILRRNRLLSVLTGAMLAQLGRCTETLKEKQIIRKDSLVIPITAVLILRKHSINGDIDKIIQVYSPGQVIPFWELGSDIALQVASKGEVLIVSKSEVRALSSRVLSYGLEILHSTTKDYCDRVSVLSSGLAEIKVERAILFLNSKPNMHMCNLRTHDVASLSGIRPETISRSAAWQEKKKECKKCTPTYAAICV